MGLHWEAVPTGKVTPGGLPSCTLLYLAILADLMLEISDQFHYQQIQLLLLTTSPLATHSLIVRRPQATRCTDLCPENPYHSHAQLILGQSPTDGPANHDVTLPRLPQSPYGRRLLHQVFPSLASRLSSRQLMQSNQQIICRSKECLGGALHDSAVSNQPRSRPINIYDMCYGIKGAHQA